MWDLFEQGELNTDRKLTGACMRDETAPDPSSVLIAVEDAREDALQRELGRVNA